MAKVLRCSTVFASKFRFCVITPASAGFTKKPYLTLFNSCHRGQKLIGRTPTVIFGSHNVCGFCTDNEQCMVLLLDKKGKDMGRVSIQEAQEYAEKHNLKLDSVRYEKDVEVYQLSSNKDRKSHIKHKKTKLHKLNFKSTITDNDANVKIKQIEQWLGKGDEVKVNIRFLNNEKNGIRLFRMMCKSIDKLAKIPKAQSTPEEMFAHFKPHKEEITPSDDKIEPLKLNKQ